jgi:hypothetical protein
MQGMCVGKYFIEKSLPIPAVTFVCCINMLKEYLLIHFPSTVAGGEIGKNYSLVKISSPLVIIIMVFHSVFGGLMVSSLHYLSYYMYTCHITP